MPAKKNFYSYAEAQAAAQTLGIKKRPDYQRRYRDDPKLPSNPNCFYADTGWTNWYDFLGNKKHSRYSTYAEAQAAAQALGIKSRSVYLLRYREDPKLSPNPHHLYVDIGWTNWYDFLGKERRDLYATYEEAQAAALALGIKCWSEYLRRYHEDPKLPASPRQVYAETGWTSQYDFFGSEEPELYSSYTEAQAAAKALSIKDSPDYHRRYLEEPKLPASPEQVYAGTGWTNWYDFLGNEMPDRYLTYAEAQVAVRALGVKTMAAYRRRYREDPKLPGNPRRFYAENGWTSSYDFLGKEQSVRYLTYTEAQEAVLALGIKSWSDYQSRYSEDPKLPPSPHRGYADIGWTRWCDFLGKL